MSTRPVRCFSCGKVLKYEEYFTKKETTQDQDIALDQMRAKICCRRMYLSYNPKLDERLELYSTSRN